MVKVTEEVCGVCMAERAVRPTEMVRQPRPHIDFNYFQRFREQITERYIEGVRSGDVFKRHALRKGVPRLLESKTVTAEPVVIDVRQKPLGSGRICNGKATRGELRYLISVRKPRFLIRGPGGLKTGYSYLSLRPCIRKSAKKEPVLDARHLPGKGAVRRV